MIEKVKIAVEATTREDRDGSLVPSIASDPNLMGC
jgi:hypothetical protein